MAASISSSEGSYGASTASVAARRKARPTATVDVSPPASSRTCSLKSLTGFVFPRPGPPPNESGTPSPEAEPTTLASAARPMRLPNIPWDMSQPHPFRFPTVAQAQP